MKRLKHPERYVFRNLNDKQLPVHMYTYSVTTPISVFDTPDNSNLIMQGDLEAFARQSIGGRTLDKLEGEGQVALHGVTAIYKPVPTENMLDCVTHVTITIHYTILCPKLVMMVTLGQTPEEALEL
jgi:hypothetical protein